MRVLAVAQELRPLGGEDDRLRENLAPALCDQRAIAAS